MRTHRDKNNCVFTKLFLGLVCTNEGSRSRDICQKQVMKFPRRLSTTFLSPSTPIRLEESVISASDWIPRKRKLSRVVNGWNTQLYVHVLGTNSCAWRSKKAREGAKRKTIIFPAASPNQGVCPEYCAYPALHYISRLAKFISLK